MNQNTKRMLAGKIYNPVDDELHKLQLSCHKNCVLYNQTYDSQILRRKSLINKIFPNHKGSFYIQGGIYVDYGVFTYIGNNFYANYGLTILDTCKVTIGDDCYFGPNVSIYTALHPLRYQDRNIYFDKKINKYTDKEYGKPITIGDNCWIAGSVTILPGVTIGSGSVIGAGSVVSKSIPANSLAYGNPIKVIRKITNEDKLSLKKELL